MVLTLKTGKNYMIHVCAAVIRLNGRYLVTSRPEGKHLAGKWEFPGGKLHDNENCAECLNREIVEELGISIVVLDKMFSVTHDYPEKTVCLDFFRAVPEDIKNFKPEGLDGQKIAWLSIEKFSCYDFAEADKPFIKMLTSAPCLI